MKSLTFGLRSLLGVAALASAVLVTGAISPSPATCQDGGEDEQEECDYGTITQERRKDGSVWLCFDWLDCGDGTVTGEDVCLKRS